MLRVGVCCKLLPCHVLLTGSKRKISVKCSLTADLAVRVQSTGDPCNATQYCSSRSFAVLLFVRRICEQICSQLLVRRPRAFTRINIHKRKAFLRRKKFGMVLAIVCCGSIYISYMYMFSADCDISDKTLYR